MSWASVLKAGAKWVGKGAKAAVETTGKAALHPQQTLKGAGTAAKTVAVGGAMGYVGWQKLTTDESVVGIVSDALIGKENTQAISDTVHGATEGLRDLKESVTTMTESVSGTMGGVSTQMNGISSFLGNVTSGEGGNMLSNFFGNLVHGNVSGLSMMGLALSAFLMFGRFGWMGKLASAMMAMMIIGNNSALRQAQTIQQPALAHAAELSQQTPQQSQEAEQIHRSRR